MSRCGVTTFPDNYKNANTKSTKRHSKPDVMTYREDCSLLGLCRHPCRPWLAGNWRVAVEAGQLPHTHQGQLCTRSTASAPVDCGGLCNATIPADNATLPTPETMPLPALTHRRDADAINRPEIVGTWRFQPPSFISPVRLVGLNKMASLTRRNAVVLRTVANWMTLAAAVHALAPVTTIPRKRRGDSMRRSRSCPRPTL